MTNSRASLPQPRGGRASGPQKTAAEAQRIAAKLTAAVALHQQGRLAQAQLLYTEILQAQPRHFDALQLLAAIAVQQKNPDAALVLFEQALKIVPGNAVVLSNQASALLDLRRYEEALKSCDSALKSRPDYAEALSNRGNALWAMNRAADALVSYDHALRIKPDYPEALSSRGAALRSLGRPLEALQSYDRALQLRPAYADALNNQGAALQELQHPAEALDSFARAQRAQPVYADAHMNEALCRLMLGEFELGWQKYEWRWKKEPGLTMARNFVQPLWLGKESLQGKTILLHAEQGLGDTIQFCRYAKDVAALGARVVLEVQPALKSLLQGVQGASLVIGKGEKLPDFDCHCPLLSLPLAFQADLSNISGAAYLHSDPAKSQHWRERLGPAGKTRVGLVWSGATGHQNDHNRSLSLAQIAPLIGGQAQYYCLQKELRPADQATLESTPGIEFLGDSLKDFSDTAGLLEQMDLVITVDTSVAHLAGAMGKEVWIMLPFSPDWRWLLERSDNPWYDSVRLFRQSAPGDWASVLGQVQEALTAKLQ